MANIGITVYGCEQDEAVLLQEMAPRLEVSLTITTAPISEDTIDLVRGNRCISINHKTSVTNAMLKALSQVGVAYISTRSAGYNHIDRDFAKRVGIIVKNVAYSPDSVADYTLMLVLMALRNTRSIIRRAEKQDFRLLAQRGKELRDMTVGVIGTGRIGTAVIDRLQGFGCRIVAYDHRPKTAARYVSLDELLQQSDIITLHTPLTAGTWHLLDSRRLAGMKPGAFVINTGRGPLIDTEALIVEMENGKLGGAALDVLEAEEGIFYTDHRQEAVKNKLVQRLQALPNVLITPHTAYYTDHALKDVIENTIINCLKFEGNNA